MSTGQKKNSLLSYIPGYSHNAVLQLIIFTGTAFAMLGVTWGVMLIVFQNDDSSFYHYFIANVALPPLSGIKAHWWTPLTYGWFHFNRSWGDTFFELLSNMLWLYCFGSVVQMLVGYRQVIPLYTYCLAAGGIVYLLAQFVPGMPPTATYALGARAGLAGMATAAITLTPRYRFYLTDTFSVPMVVVAAVFGGLMIIGTGLNVPLLLLVAAGALAGFAYIKLLKAGYRPGAWMYDVSARVERLVTPNEHAISSRAGARGSRALNKSYAPKTGISQQRIDDILDKINQKGYNSLTAEEKDVLLRAGKE